MNWFLIHIYPISLKLVLPVYSHKALSWLNLEVHYERENVGTNYHYQYLMKGVFFRNGFVSELSDFYKDIPFLCSSIKA